tara:strand:- start:1133 stop:1339 length:207 start_codon:yes stop_codon:yes gene_type:complete
MAALTATPIIHAIPPVNASAAGLQVAANVALTAVVISPAPNILLANRVPPLATTARLLLARTALDAIA